VHGAAGPGVSLVVGDAVSGRLVTLAVVGGHDAVRGLGLGGLAVGVSSTDVVSPERPVALGPTRGTARRRRRSAGPHVATCDF
jgi:hypothetical protein